MSVISTADKAL